MKRQWDRPPKFFLWILRRLFIYEEMFAISKDFEIEYTGICQYRGRIIASLWLIWNTMQALCYYLIFTAKWRTIMFRNYFKIAFRNIKRHKGYSFINIFGLTVGIACVIVIMLWVQYETSFEKHHEKADRIFRVAGENLEFSPPSKMVVTPPPMSPALAQEFPEIEASVRVSRGGDKKLFSFKDKHFYEPYNPVDASFFNIFSIDFVKGDAGTVFSDPYAIVLSEKMAGKLFGSQDPINKIIQFDQKTDFTVTGIFKSMPPNSHLRSDILIPFETWGKLYEEPLDHWMYWSFYTYILLRPNGETQELEAKFPAFTEKHGIPKVKLFLQPLKSIHLHSHFQGEISSNTQISTLLLFGFIALLILIIACINYMNLTTARSSIRLKEIGTRKVFGAQRRQIAWQFLGESILTSLLSLSFSLLLVSLFLPFFNALAERHLALNGESLIPILPGILLLALFVGSLAGSYPAFLLSSFKPITVLRGGGGRGSQKTRLRNVLVVVQFSGSLILIIATLLVNRQLDFVRNKEIGFDRDQVVTIALREPEVSRNVGPVIEELKRNSGILYASSSMHLPNDVGAATTANWPGKPEDLKIWIKASETGYDFTELYGIEIVQGRGFSREFPSDKNGAFLINETAVKTIGNDFHLGLELRHWRGKDAKGKIIGVMKDFHLNSLREEIKPLYYYLNPQEGRHLSIKIQGGSIPETIAFIRETIKKFSPKYPFEYHFFDDIFNMAYIEEQKMERIFGIFALIGIFIASMGVFGLSAFIADQKRKEIGVRKVLGAPVSKIIYLLSRDLIKLVLLANIIGWPVAYYAMNQWLQNFAYRTNINIGTFLLSAVLTLLVSLGTLSFQTIKAATSNPVDSLRYE